MRIFINIILVLLITGCYKKNTYVVNRELSGVWDNQNKCRVTFMIKNNQLVLVSMKANNLFMQNISLITYKKTGTVFIKTKNNKFEANYVDGDLFIPTLCNPSLHKISNFIQ